MIENRILTENSDSVWTHLVDADSKPLGVDVDPVTCKLFWSTGTKNANERKGTINVLSLVDSSSTTIHSGLGYPVQIAVNWITRKLYWSDTVLLTIEYSDLDGANRQTLLSGVTRAEAIALDPRINVIYWISKEHDFAISKMKLDGTNTPVTIVSSNLESPNSLVIDFTFCRLYWTDSYKIGTCDFEGKGQATVYTTTSRCPTAISLYDNILYWAEWSSTRIARCTTDGKSLSSFVNNVDQTATTRVVHKSRQPRSCEHCS